MGAPVCWFEFGGRDAGGLADFYEKMFDWKSAPMGPFARSIDTGTKEGIMGHVSAIPDCPPNYCVIYMQVDDLHIAVAKAKGLGAKVCVPPTDVPGMGAFSWLNDPQGNMFGLWKPLGK